FVVFAMTAWLTARADALTFTLNHVFSGAIPGGDTTYATITITDGPAANQVTVTIAASLTGSEFLTEFDFNVNLTSPYSLAFGPVSGDATVGFGPSCGGDPCVPNSFKSDGDGSHDISLIFSQAAGTGQFAGTDTVSFTITGTNGTTGLDATDFDALGTTSA